MSALLELTACALAAGGSTAVGLAVIPRISDAIRGRQETLDNRGEPDETPTPDTAAGPLPRGPQGLDEDPARGGSDLCGPVRAA